MNEFEYKQLIEESWRRKLTLDEEAHLLSYLAAQPHAQAQWDDELALTGLLRQLPDAPLSSNFTAQVLQAVAREEAAAARRPSVLGWLRRVRQRPAPRLAWAAVFVGLIGFSGVVLKQAANNQAMASGLVLVSHVAGRPEIEPKTFEDFDTIYQAAQKLVELPPSRDEELFAVLNQ